MKTAVIILSILSGVFIFQKFNSAQTKLNQTLTAPEEHLWENLISWQDLNYLTYTEVYIDSLEAWFWQPKFDQCLMDLNGQTIHISGFLQNMGTKADPYYVASEYQHLHLGCCGISGPEDVIDLGGITPSNDELQDSIIFTGTLVLNSGDVYRLNYTLENAELIMN